MNERMKKHMNYTEEKTQHTIELKIITKEIHAFTKRNFKNQLNDREQDGEMGRKRSERARTNGEKKSISVSSTLTWFALVFNYMKNRVRRNAVHFRVLCAHSTRRGEKHFTTNTQNIKWETHDRVCVCVCKKRYETEKKWKTKDMTMGWQFGKITNTHCRIHRELNWKKVRAIVVMQKKHHEQSINCFQTKRFQHLIFWVL